MFYTKCYFSSGTVLSNLSYVWIYFCSHISYFQSCYAIQQNTRDIEEIDALGAFIGGIIGVELSFRIKERLLQILLSVSLLLVSAKLSYMETKFILIRNPINYYDTWQNKASIYMGYANHPFFFLDILLAQLTYRMLLKNSIWTLFFKEFFSFISNEKIST
jgi:hypothetical protein